MGRSSLSIASWMVVILLAAFDIVALSPLATSGHSFFGKQSDPFFDVTLLPLALTLQGLLVITVNRRGRIRPSLAGFQASGWVVVALYAGLASTPGLLGSMLQGAGRMLEAAGLGLRPQGKPLLRISVAALILIGPQWCLALAGGAVAGYLFPDGRRVRRVLEDAPSG